MVGVAFPSDWYSTANGRYVVVYVAIKREAGNWGKRDTSEGAPKQSKHSKCTDETLKKRRRERCYKTIFRGNDMRKLAGVHMRWSTRRGCCTCCTYMISPWFLLATGFQAGDQTAGVYPCKEAGDVEVPCF